jgi:cell division protein FtsB
MSERIRMLVLGLIACIGLGIGTVRAGDSSAAVTSNDPQIAALQAQIAELKAEIEQLKAQVAALQAKVEPVAAQATAQQRVDMCREQARARMREDAARRSQAELAQAEKLYQVANKDFGSDEAKASLREMIEKFPDVNRTGCAVLYLAQMSQGAEREALLRQAIADFGDCFYGDGVQVGAYARYYLAWDLFKSDRKDEAAAVVKELIEKYPEAIDHKGRLVREQLPAR